MISVAEYLQADFEFDHDYVDGEVVERNYGERDHSVSEAEVAFAFRKHRDEWKSHACIALTLQTSETRFRVADVCVYIGQDAKQRHPRTPPAIVVEVVSPDDRFRRIQDRIDDYLNFGVRHVWLIDPASRRAWVCSAGRWDLVQDGVLRTDDPSIKVNLPEIFAALDE